MKKVRKFIKRVAAAALAAAVAAGLTGCGSVTSGKRIIRVSHAQSETHPEHIGLLAFKEYVEERLGDKYEVQIYTMFFNIISSALTFILFINPTHFI